MEAELPGTAYGFYVPVSPKRTVQPVTGLNLFLIQFSATLAAVLIGGVVLGLGVRSYLHWSVEDTARQVQQAKESPDEKERQKAKEERDNRFREASLKAK